MLKNSPNLFADYVQITTRLNFVGKGVSDLEMFMDYFAPPRRSCENYNFCFPAQTMVAKVFIHFPLYLV